MGTSFHIKITTGASSDPEEQQSCHLCKHHLQCWKSTRTQLYLRPKHATVNDVSSTTTSTVGQTRAPAILLPLGAPKRFTHTTLLLHLSYLHKYPPFHTCMRIDTSAHSHTCIRKTIGIDGVQAKDLLIKHVCIATHAEARTRGWKQGHVCR